MLALVSSLAVDLYTVGYKSTTYRKNHVMEYTIGQENPFNRNEKLYMRISALKSREGDFLQFSKPLTVHVKNEDGLVLLEWIEDEDVFGMGETMDEAQEDLLYNIEGILAMKDFDESELSPEAKALVERLASKIEKIK